jgi:hypothetical protein
MKDIRRTSLFEVGGIKMYRAQIDSWYHEMKLIHKKRFDTDTPIHSNCNK